MFITPTFKNYASNMLFVITYFSDLYWFGCIAWYFYCFLLNGFTFLPFYIFGLSQSARCKNLRHVFKLLWYHDGSICDSYFTLLENYSVHTLARKPTIPVTMLVLFLAWSASESMMVWYNVPWQLLVINTFNCKW